jgi:60 kDa SS-A/Ro ribonucleoprotein
MVAINKSRTAATQATITAEATINEEGAPAFVLTAKNRLIERVLGAFWSENLFYKKGEPIAAALVADLREVAATDPKFVLQLAAFARQDMNLRTTPQVLLAEASRIDGCKPLIREYAPKIVVRPDEVTDVLAYLLSTSPDGKKLPNQLKWGLADAIAKFDEYQLFKYDSSKAALSLGGALRLVHRHAGFPVSQAMSNYLEKDLVDAQALPKIAAIKALMAKDGLDQEARDLIATSHAPWEVVISKFGSGQAAWEVAETQMPYMAKLRNLRNFIKAGIALEPILAELKDPERVRKSRQLPFRFYAAYCEVEDQLVRRAIAAAFEASVSNVQIAGKTAIAVDLSGSMDSKLSAKSKVSYKDVGCVLGAMALRKSAESLIIGFGDKAIPAVLNPDDTMMTNMEKIKDLPTGWSTNAWLIFDAIGDKVFDRIILLSDMQCYDSQSGGYYGGRGQETVRERFAQYRVKVNPKAVLYSVDLSAYGTAQFSSVDGGVVKLNGWSDRILDLIAANEGKEAMLGAIAKW